MRRRRREVSTWSVTPVMFARAHIVGLTYFGVVRTSTGSFEVVVVLVLLIKRAMGWLDLIHVQIIAEPHCVKIEFAAIAGR